MSAPTGNAELEDLAVGSGGLSSGRDRDLPETAPPRDTANWISVSMQHLSSVGYMPPARIRNVTLWLPKDRKLTMHIVEVYFKQLNFHRPVLIKRDFEHVLNMLYEKQHVGVESSHPSLPISDHTAPEHVNELHPKVSHSQLVE